MKNIFLTLLVAMKIILIRECGRTVFNGLKSFLEFHRNLWSIRSLVDHGNLFSKLTLVKLPFWRIFPIVDVCVWEIWYIPWCFALCWRSLVGDYRQSGMLVMLCPLCSWNMCAWGYFHQNVPFISLFGKIMNINLNFAWQNTSTKK